MGKAGSAGMYRLQKGDEIVSVNHVRHVDGLRSELLNSQRLFLGIRRPGRTTWPSTRPMTSDGEEEEPVLPTMVCLEAINQRWQEMNAQLDLGGAPESVKKVVKRLKHRVTRAVDSAPAPRPEDLMDVATRI